MRCRKIHVDVEPLGLEAREPRDNGQKLLTDLVQIVKTFVETEFVKVVGAELVAQEYMENFSYCLKNRALEIGAEDVVIMLDLIDDGEELVTVIAA